jgi:glutamate dehydrogenase/leucine dehydrogenase
MVEINKIFILIHKNKTFIQFYLTTFKFVMYKTSKMLKSLKKSFAYRGTSEPKFLETIQSIFNDASKYTDIPVDRLALLSTPDTTIKINIPLLRDNGTFLTIPAFRCHHKLHLLPAKGGIRISPRITFDSIEGLALLSCFQLSLLEIPFGGAKGGIKMDTTKFSEAEIARVLRRYTIELVKYNFIGPGVDVPGPEYGSNSKHMDIMKDTYLTIYGMHDINANAVVTGKTYGNEGVPNHEQAHASGVYYSIKHIVESEFLKDYRKFYKLKQGIANQKVILEGFDENTQFIAKYLYSKGAKILGIQLWDGCIYNMNGINIPEFFKYYETHNTSQGFLDVIEDKEILERECDVLVIGNTLRGINLQNADKIKAKMIVEAINGGISYESNKVLNSKNILVLPDILCNSGKQISSYLEWLKNIQHKRLGRLTQKWQEKSRHNMISAIQDKIGEAGYKIDLLHRVDKYLQSGASNKDIVQTSIDNFIGEALQKIIHKSLKEDCDLRIASFAIAMDNIYESYKDNDLYK